VYQSFETAGDGAKGPVRLALLRGAMATAGVDAFLVPRGDAHQGETVPARDERLRWLTGFTGSAGLCAVLAERAALFVDGRYGLQARAEVASAAFEVVDTPATMPSAWLEDALPRGAVIGLDPMLHTAADAANYAAIAEAAGGAVRWLDENLIDAVWSDQPAPPLGRVVPHPLTLSGESAEHKRARVGAAIRDAGAAATVLSLPASIAWLLNIRGGDVARLPAPLAFAIVRNDGSVSLFVAPEKLDDDARAHLGDAVSPMPPEALRPALDGMAGQTVLVDRDSAPFWITRRLEAAGATVKHGRDPCVLPKALKNDTELAGARAAHRRDGVAMARFLHWLDVTAPETTLTEIDVVEQLEAFRRRDNAMRDIAFDTICGAGPNGAIVHYRVSRATNRPLAAGAPLLVDSGAQYLDGTTDVTRTIAIGAPDAEARRLFTLVLKGMIAISVARFPPGTTGRDLDALARRALWAAGHDYDHGTGHGVGSYLSVHEGPQGISKRSAEPLRPGMILSNEPGCYLEGRFGIRIETLVAVTPPSAVSGGAREMLGFETLTLAPIDRRLIDPALLETAERGWIDAYHARVFEEIGPLVETDVAAWLEEACAPL
jgi:Xaa-Pro aminopeptidase